MQKKEEKWEKEKLQFMKKIEKLENKMERDEKQKRKNIIIKWIPVSKGQEQQEVEKFLDTKLQIQVKVESKNEHLLNQNKRYPIVRAEIEKFKQNQEIMKVKNKWEVSTEDNDLAVEARVIQKG